ncbi:Ig-like domain-containing protein [Arsenophonus endosymbiont of Aleurodicus floccissimus]|uniref:Ig-like domain-containing protein n=1 Tax=Arsenophonus endosymbiont of Aleurodicus floccissimus TaxID=2152761 RepID=UPI0015FFEF33|nr:Ig-like domain-containing protein [Arsenophonus endosymbiont of Aleurodicus floccissimus]
MKRKKIADNNSFFTFTAQLVDGNDNPIKQKGLDVNWSHNKDSEVKLAAKSQTDENGGASVVLYSTTAAIKGVVVSARFGSTKRVDADREVAFIADESSIIVKSVRLNDQIDSKLANDHNKFTFTALVLDVNDNPARQRMVKWAHNKNDEVTLSATTSETDENGRTTIMLHSTNTVVNNIIVNASYGTSAPINAQPVEFHVDTNTAQVGSVTLVDSEVNKVSLMAVITLHLMLN